MTWLKLEDELPDHPKIAAAGPLAAWVYICGLCYCNRYLTDGFIPSAIAHNLVDFTGIDVALTDDEHGLYEHHPSCAVICGVLCEKKLWKRTKNGYQVHDYLAHQRSKKDVDKHREAARLRQKRGRESRNVSRRDRDRDTSVTHSEVSWSEVEVEKQTNRTVPLPPKLATPAGAETETDGSTNGQTPTFNWDTILKEI